MMDDKTKTVSPHGALGTSIRKSGSAVHMADAPRTTAAAAGKPKPQVRRTPDMGQRS
jgi:hypothetical protein